MSSSYYLFTEGFIESKWTCLNTYLKKDDKYIMTETYYSGSRTYFSSTFDKLEKMGQQIKKEDLSPDLQNWINEDSTGQVLIVSLDDIQKSMPRSQKYEYHGYVEKSTVFLFEANELEDIFEWLSPDEYMALNEEIRKSYQYSAISSVAISFGRTLFVSIVI